MSDADDLSIAPMPSDHADYRRSQEMSGRASRELVESLRVPASETPTDPAALKQCACGGAVEIVSEPTKTRWRDNPPVVVTAPFTRCTVCGEAWYTGRQSMRHSDAVRDATVAALRAEVDRLTTIESLSKRVIVAWGEGCSHRSFHGALRTLEVALAPSLAAETPA